MQQAWLKSGYTEGYPTNALTWVNKICYTKVAWRSDLLWNFQQCTAQMVRGRCIRIVILHSYSLCPVFCSLRTFWARCGFYMKFFSYILSLCKFLSFALPCGEILHGLISLFCWFWTAFFWFLLMPVYWKEKWEKSSIFCYINVAGNFTDLYCFPLSFYSSLIDINKKRLSGIYDRKEISN